MEVNVFKKSLSRVVARIAYVYPSTYKAMISGLSPDIVYGMLNENDEVYVERFSCSKLNGVEETPRSLETGSLLKDFPLILTSIHYEPDIVNLARLLISSGIEVLAKNREKHIVVAGGPACMNNPIPYSDVVDACIIGEAEVTLDKVVEKWVEYGDVKKKFLEELASLNYVYAPGITSGPVYRVYVEDLDKSYYPLRQVENTEIEPVYGRGFKLEVSRGCPFWCSFCMETRLFQPYRERSLSELKRILEKGLRYSLGGNRLVVFSLAFPVTRTHYDILEYLRGEGYKASIPSLRITPYLEKSLETIKSLGQRTLTIAPESFSPVIQQFTLKYVGLLDYVTQALEEFLVKGFDLKLYLIYGFRGFLDLEYSANLNYLMKLIKLAKSLKRKISLSINPLIPKPHTPFQWVGMLPRDILMASLRQYKSALKELVETRAYDVDWAIVQAQIALSPSPLGAFIDLWARFGGGLAGWRRATRVLGVNYKYVFTGYDLDSELPWGFIKLGSYCEKVNRSQFSVYERLPRSLDHGSK